LAAKCKDFFHDGRNHRVLASVNTEQKSSIHDRFSGAALKEIIWDSSTSELSVLELKLRVQSLCIADVFSDQLTYIK